ncbi:hypothetical protein [Metabacillus schmidteae]|uniref:hypothetical protein n=1 Tax=Metabacillus schmidteae TaxID=2730405 RepID=UPI00158A239E|nr:hypothetical protein [Metabacillus schmidteae]
MKDKTNSEGRGMSFMGLMKDKTKSEGRGMSFMGLMKDKTKSKIKRNILQKAYERQSRDKKEEKCLFIE